MRRSDAPWAIGRSANLRTDTSEPERDQPLRPLHNTFVMGPAHALRYGIDHAVADVVVTMADRSDDTMQIYQLMRLVERGSCSHARRGCVGGSRLSAPGSRAAFSGLRACPERGRGSLGTSTGISTRSG